MPESAVAAEPTAVASVEPSSLTALQEDAAPRARDTVARKRCDALLAALARLQRALLGGVAESAPADSALAELARLATEPVAADDPVLRGALAGAALRARIELARRERPARDEMSHANPLSAWGALATERPTPSCLI